jgi:iron complex outermembrane receptor protein
LIRHPLQADRPPSFPRNLTEDPMKKFPLSTITFALMALGAAAQAQQATEVGKITVTGEGDKLGTGLMIDEDTPKAKSTVTKAQIDKLRSSGNPFQAMALLPGVNSNSQDATGLFGGNLRVRGFNSDQMGFTINGAPVNDSGSFSVFPQEYSDAENLCEIFVTQGATDTEAPHIGASGGNVGLNTCAPKEVAGGKAAFSAGDLSYTRIFLRGDTGKIGGFKGFLSASKSEANKWKGLGKADRQHIDAGAEYDMGTVKLSGSFLWNKAVNNNLRTLTLAQLATEGYYADFATTPPPHLTPVNGTRQAESFGTAYYGYSLNPFENYLITTKANIQLSPALRLDIAPYYWYGYGTGGTQQTTVNEGLGANRIHGGLGDINGDGDALDQVMIYRGSVTKTNRPGVSVNLSYTLDNQRILGGVWYERARHRQTAPGTTFSNSGQIGDLWLANESVLLHYADGSLYQNRDVLTISTGESAFIQDTIDLFNSKVQVTPAISYRRINRDFTNFGSSGANAAYTTTPLNFSTAADYKINKTYSQALPSLAASFQVTPEAQLFGSLSKNFKAPGNFEYFGLATGVTIANGTGSLASLAPLTVKQETSVNLDLGARYKNSLFKASATAFLNKFKDRIASSFDPVTTSSHDFNVGDSTIKGLELEVGTVPVGGFSAYASATYTRSTIDKDMPALGSAAGITAYYPVSGVQFPDTPKGMAALSLQYTNGPLLLNLAGKYTGRRNITLVGDQTLAGYTTIDLNAALQLPSDRLFKSPTVRLNVSNITSKQFLLANSGSGSSITTNAFALSNSGLTVPSGGTPSVYGGAPRFISVTLQSDF